MAKRAVEELSSPGVLEQTAPELPPTPNYTKEEEQWAKEEKGKKEKWGGCGSCLIRDSLFPVLQQPLW
jgi:hypothetical protein